METTNRGAIRYQRDGNVATITISRPNQRNALRLVDRVEMAEAMAAGDRDPKVRVVVVRGASGAFCSGGDVGEMGAESSFDLALSYGEEYAQLVFRQLRRMSTPTVAVVEGVAAGAGMFLALACDICLATPESRFIASHLRIGVPPDWGGMWLLPRLVGIARAKAILLTGRPIDGSTAAEWGLVAEVVPVEAMQSVLDSYCSALAALPPGATRLAKRGIDCAFDMGAEAFLAFELAGIGGAMVSQQHHDRVAAFVGRSATSKET